MTLLAALAMLAVLMASVRLFGSWCAPAVVYCASWTGALFALALVRPLLYGVTFYSGGVYVVAAVLFSLGALIGQRFTLPRRPGLTPRHWNSRSFSVLLNVALVTVLLCTPFIVRDLLASGGVESAALALREARLESVVASGETGSFTLLGNVPLLAQGRAAVIRLSPRPRKIR